MLLRRKFIVLRTSAKASALRQISGVRRGSLGIDHSRALRWLSALQAELWHALCVLAQLLTRSSRSNG